MSDDEDSNGVKSTFMKREMEGDAAERNVGNVQNYIAQVKGTMVGKKKKSGGKHQAGKKGQHGAATMKGMDGGTKVQVSAGCTPLGEGGENCPFSNHTKIEGKFYDMCWELAQGLGIDIETHCSDLDTKLACNKVNTCKWTSGECVYTAGK